MARKISTITAVAGAALVLAVPAFGDNWGAADKAQTTTVDARSNGLNRLYGLGEYATALDVRDSALVEKASTKPEQQRGAGFDARSDGLNRIYGLGKYAAPVVSDNRFRIGPTNAPALVAPSSGTDLDWPQIGIGFGVGIALALGLYLAMRATRPRTLAH